MTTFKEISDKSFSITFVTSEFNSTTPSISGKLKHSGLEWSMKVYRSTSDDLACFLSCQANNSSLWSVKAGVSFKITSKINAEHAHSIKYVSDFNLAKSCWGSTRFVEKDNLTNEYIDYGKITIECIVEIKSLVGLQLKTTKQFAERDEDLSDIVLIVEGKMLHVNKAILANASPVFRAMFYSRFQESTADRVVIKDDVKYDAFVDFLQIVYHGHVDIDCSNVEGLLCLADRFDVGMITQKCELFLLFSKEKPVGEKLKLADTYKLSMLHSSCLDSIKKMSKMSELKEASKDLENMGEATLKALLTKAISFTSIE